MGEGNDDLWRSGSRATLLHRASEKRPVRLLIPSGRLRRTEFPTPAVIEAKGSVSGKDYYVTNTDYNDQVLEIRQVGNNVYWRQGTDGAWTQRGVQPRIPHDVLGLGETPICPDVTNVIQKALKKTLDGVKTIRYVSGDVPWLQKRRRWNLIRDFTGSKYIYFHEHWIRYGWPARADTGLRI